MKSQHRPPTWIARGFRSDAEESQAAAGFGHCLLGLAMVGLLLFVETGCSDEARVVPEPATSNVLSGGRTIIEGVGPEVGATFVLDGRPGWANRYRILPRPARIELAGDPLTLPSQVDSVTFEVPILAKGSPTMTIVPRGSEPTDVEVTFVGERPLGDEELAEWRRRGDLAAIRRTMTAGSPGMAGREAARIRAALTDFAKESPIECADYLDDLAFALAEADSLAADVDQVLSAALTLRLTHLPAQDPRIAQSLTLLASLAFNLGDYERAADFETQAHEILVSDPEADPSEVAASNRELGLTYHHCGRYREAVACMEQSLQFEESRPDLDLERLADLHNNLSETLRVIGRVEESRRHIESAVSLARLWVEGASGLDARAEQRSFLVSMLINAAGHAFDRGEFIDAERSYQEILGICRSSPEPLDSEPTVLRNMAETLRRQGRTEEALPYFDLARETAYRGGQAVAIDRFWVNYQEAELWLQRGALDRASSLAGAALSELESMGESARVYLYFPKGLLGRIRTAQRRYDEAVRFQREALELELQLLGPRSTEVSSTRIELADALMADRARYVSEAESLARIGLAGLERTGERPDVRIQGRRILADAEWLEGDPSSAFAHLRSTVADVRDFQRIAAVTPESRSAVLDLFYSAYQTLIDWYLETGKVDSALVAFEEARSEEWLEQIRTRGRDPLDSLPDSLRVRLAERQREAYAALAETRAKLVLGGRGGLRIEGESQNVHLEERYAAAKREYAAVSAEILRQGGAWTSISSVDRPSLEALRNSLDVGETALCYHLGSRSTRVFVLSPDRAVASVELTVPPALSALTGVETGPLSESKLDELLEWSVSDRLESMGDASVWQVDGAFWEAIGALLLPSVVGDAARAAESVLVVADGSLERIPVELAALDDGWRWIQSGPPVRYAPSLRVAAALGELGRIWSPGTVLAIGGAEPVVAPQFSEGRRQIRGLPGAKREADEVAAIYGVQGIHLSGARATEASLRSHVGRAAIVHVATHGIVNSGLGMTDAYLTFSPGSGDPSDDGILDRSEVASLELHADLVVLAACETHVGTIYRGEGTQSLARAFMVEGCPRVVGTLWPVDDQATQRVMVEFHRRLAEMLQGSSVDPARALLEAKRTVAASPETASPYFWAPFTLLGAGRGDGPSR